MAELLASAEHLEHYRQIIEQVWDCADRLHEINKYCSGWSEEVTTDGSCMMRIFTKKEVWTHTVAGVEMRTNGIEVSITTRYSPSGAPVSPTISITSW